MYAFSAAHKTLPLPSFARVTNLANGKSVIVRVNDRGPFHEGRIIDLSYAAAVKLGVDRAGTARVEVKGLSAGENAREPYDAIAARPAPAPPSSTRRARGNGPTDRRWHRTGADRDRPPAVRIADRQRQCRRAPTAGAACGRRERASQPAPHG